MEIERDSLESLRKENRRLQAYARQLECSLNHEKSDYSKVEYAASAAEIGSWDWNVETGEVIFSDNWKKILGYGPDELDDAYDTWRLRVHPDDVDESLANLEANLNGTTAFYFSEHRLKKRDGSWIWVLARGAVVERNAEGKPLRHCGIHVDVNASRELTKSCEFAKRNAEKELGALIVRLEQVASVISGFVYVMDIRTRKLIWSCGMLDAMTGYTAEEINALPDGWIGLVHPEADSDVSGFQVSSNRGRSVLEYRIRTRYGEKWIRDNFIVTNDLLNGTPGMIGFVEDITAQRQLSTAGCPMK